MILRWSGMFFLLQHFCVLIWHVGAFTNRSVKCSRHEYYHLVSNHDSFLALRPEGKQPMTADDTSSDDDSIGVDMETFQARKKKLQETKEKEDSLPEFDGYALRDVIYEKWGYCYDVDFNRVDSFGLRSLYLNVLPFHLGGRRFRHETEMDYLCHLQAVVEILEKYGQLGYVLSQIDETNKKPRSGTSPLVAVPLRLDLTRDQVQEIIGY